MEINIPLLITIFIILIILLIFIITFSYSNRFPDTDKLKIDKELKRIDNLIYKGYFSSRDVIVRLDAILSRSMQIRYNNEDNCGINLRKSKPLIYKELYEKIWKYHKLRNEIVHENIEIKKDDVYEGYKVYKSVIDKIVNK